MREKAQSRASVIYYDTGKGEGLCRGVAFPGCEPLELGEVEGDEVGSDGEDGIDEEVSDPEWSRAGRPGIGNNEPRTMGSTLSRWLSPPTWLPTDVTTLSLA